MTSTALIGSNVFHQFSGWSGPELPVRTGSDRSFKCDPPAVLVPAARCRDVSEFCGLVLVPNDAEDASLQHRPRPAGGAGLRMTSQRHGGRGVRERPLQEDSGPNRISGSGSDSEGGFWSKSIRSEPAEMKKNILETRTEPSVQVLVEVLTGSEPVLVSFQVLTGSEPCL